jgi:hypothetical protein
VPKFAARAGVSKAMVFMLHQTHNKDSIRNYRDRIDETLKPLINVPGFTAFTDPMGPLAE